MRFADPDRRLVAVHLGHFDIEEDEIIIADQRGCQCLATVRDDIGAIALKTQQSAYRGSENRVVIGEEDFQGGCLRVGGGVDNPSTFSTLSPPSWSDAAWALGDVAGGSVQRESSRMGDRLAYAFETSKGTTKDKSPARDYVPRGAVWSKTA